MAAHSAPPPSVQTLHKIRGGAIPLLENVQKVLKGGPLLFLHISEGGGPPSKMCKIGLSCNNLFFLQHVKKLKLFFFLFFYKLISDPQSLGLSSLKGDAKPGGAG